MSEAVSENEDQVKIIAELRREAYFMLGLVFDARNLDFCMDEIADSIHKKKRLWISTTNWNWLATSIKDTRFHHSIINSDINVIDGVPVLWLAKLHGIPVSNVVAGASIVEQLRDRKGKQYRLFLFGGNQGVAKRAHQYIDSVKTGFSAGGFHDPGFHDLTELLSEDNVNRINRSRADIVIISLGASKGSQFIEQVNHRIMPCVIAHFGAAMEHLSGQTKRAPSWMQKLALEWLWRVLLNPFLLKRYVVDSFIVLPVLMKLLFYKVAGLFQSRSEINGIGCCKIEQSSQGRVMSFDVGAKRDEALVLKELSHTVLSGMPLTIDFIGVDRINSRMLGLLVLLTKMQYQRGQELVLKNVNPCLLRAFTQSRFLAALSVIGVKQHKILYD